MFDDLNKGKRLDSINKPLYSLSNSMLLELRMKSLLEGVARSTVFSSRFWSNVHLDGSLNSTTPGQVSLHKLHNAVLKSLHLFICKMGVMMAQVPHVTA